jgi:hypothetical protein
MMRRNSILAMALALGALALFGCGGSKSDPTPGGGDFRKVLGGDGATAAGGATTTKTWLVVATRPGGASADTPCVENPATSFDECESIQYRSDGKATSSIQKGTFGYPRFSDEWAFSGSTFSYTFDNGAFGTFIDRSTVTDEGVVGGKRRLRLHLVSNTEPGPVTRPGDGSETVIEEVL